MLPLKCAAGMNLVFGSTIKHRKTISLQPKKRKNVQSLASDMTHAQSLASKFTTV